MLVSIVVVTIMLSIRMIITIYSSMLLASLLSLCYSHMHQAQGHHHNIPIPETLFLFMPSFHSLPSSFAICMWNLCSGTKGIKVLCAIPYASIMQVFCALACKVLFSSCHHYLLMLLYILMVTQSAVCCTTGPAQSSIDVSLAFHTCSLVMHLHISLL